VNLLDTRNVLELCYTVKTVKASETTSSKDICFRQCFFNERYIDFEPETWK